MWSPAPDDRPARERPGGEKETGRVEAFSDGVYAIAITLLVLEIRVPAPGALGPGGLGAALLGQWPQYLAFLTGFATIGVMWINHHRLFTLIRRVDSALLGLNLLLLLGISALPFPTALIAEYAALPGPDATVAAAVYSSTGIWIALCYNLLWRYAAAGDRLLGAHVDRASADAISRQYWFGPLFYAVAFALAFVSVPVCLLLQLGLAVFFALPQQTAARLNPATRRRVPPGP